MKKSKKILTLDDIKLNVEQVAKDFDVTKVSLFGSYASGKQTKESDVDLLVEFATPSVSLFKICGLKVELEELLNKDVDVIHAPISPDSLLEIDHEVLIYG